LRDPAGRDALKALLASANIVIEASRPRALLQLGIDADMLVQQTPGLVWLTITAHGILGGAANWIGFGDDCGVAGGLSAALRDATGEVGFVGDAIADPLTGIAAARAAVEQRHRGTGGRLIFAMSAIAAEALADEQRRDPDALRESLAGWAAARGNPFPPAPERASGPVSPLGADNGVWLETWCAC
jgi:crotonobetainyl-CoA:carnitine CoA-transferase CaiB-like acyl-CoA transferase